MTETFCQVKESPWERFVTWIIRDGNVLSGELFVVGKIRRNETYRAAVVEFSVHDYDSPYDDVDVALSEYIQFIKEAKENGADIIVFPELTLNSISPITVPDESENVQPWQSPGTYSKILRELSTAANNHTIYVVANVAEKFNDTNSENGTGEIVFFNTNFVLDRTGKVISRYRKINLYGEFSRIPSQDKKLGVFETDFGVKFGHFICFDILFQQPAVQILTKENVSNVIFPTMWFSELPFLTAMQIQESWAYTHNVNFLAAGANRPEIGSTGTGIYIGKWGRDSAFMLATPTHKIIYADVPKTPPTERRSVNNPTTREVSPPDVMDNLFLKSNNLKVHRSVVLNGSGEYALSHNDVMCTVNVVFVPGVENIILPKYSYRAIVFDGVRSFTHVTGGVAECGVVACTDTDDITSCATRFPNSADIWLKNTIRSIEIKATIPKPEWNETMSAPNIVYYPVSVDASITPIEFDRITYNTKFDENTSEIFMDINDLDKDEYTILAFGFFGRVYNKDGLPATDSGYSFKAGYFSPILSLIISIVFMLNY